MTSLTWTRSASTFGLALARGACTSGGDDSEDLEDVIDADGDPHAACG